MKALRGRSCVAAAMLVATALPLFGQEKGGPDGVLRPYLSGNGLLSRGMYELAAKEYREFLKDHPDHEKAATARYGLGVALVRMKQYDQAAEALSPLRDLKGFEFGAEAELLLAQCDLARGNLEPAAESLERLMRTRTDSAVADDAASLLAETRYRAGQYEKTESACRDFLSRKPDSPQRDRVELLWGMASMARENYPHAAEHFGAVTGRAGGSPLAQQAVVLRAQCLQRSGDLEGAAKLFEQGAADKTSTFSGEAAVGLASLRRQQGKPDQAAELLDRLLRETPDSPVAGAASLERARAWFDQGKYEEAKRALQEAAKKPGVAADEAEYWTAKCELRAGDPARAAARLKTAISKHPDSRLLPEMTYDRAVSLLRAGRDEEAGKALSEFRARFSDHALAADALEAQATLEHRAGRYDQSLAMCREFLGAYPKHVLRTPVEFLAAENLCLAGKQDEAAEAFRAFVSAHAGDASATRARLRLGTLLFGQAKYDEARPLLEEAAKAADKDPAFRPAVLCLGDLQFQQQRWAAAERTLARYEAFGDDAPSADDAILKRGLALARLGKHDEALRAFDRLLERFPKSGHRLQADFERGQTLLALNRPEDAKAAFKKVLKDGQDSPFAPYALTQLGSMTLQSGDASAAAERFESAASMAKDPETRGEAVFQKGQSLLSAGRYPAAVEAFALLLHDLPDHKRAAQARAQRAVALARIERNAEALEALEEAGNAPSLDEPTRQALAYERATCLKALQRPDDAALILRKLAATGSSAVAPYAMLDLAAMESEAGRLDAASELLTAVRVAAQGGTVPPAVRDQSTYRLAVVRFRQDNPREALQLLDDYFKSSPPPQGDLVAPATLLAGECRFKLGRAQEAARDFRRIIEEFPKDGSAPTALLRLGDALAAAQDWSASEQAFTDYLRKNPESDLWFQAQFGLGWARENHGRHGEAIDAYRRVTDKHNGPTAARSQFQIGECLFAQKKYQEAAAELLKVDILYAYPEWSAAALYEAGRCLESLNKPEQAAEQFRAVQDKFPKTKWAELAAAKAKPGRAAPVLGTSTPGTSTSGSGGR